MTDAIASSSQWLKLREATAYVHVSAATLRREIRAGRLRAARVGGRRCIRLRRESLDDWLESSTRPVKLVTRS